MAAPRILSVCSENVLQSLRAAVLQSHGYTVLCSNGQADAAEAIAENLADCILLGFTLSADEQTSLIRLARQSASKPPVLVMSRNSEVIRAAAAGIDPLDGPAQLVSAIDQLLGQTDPPKARVASAQ